MLVHARQLEDLGIITLVASRVAKVMVKIVQNNNIPHEFIGDILVILDISALDIPLVKSRVKEDLSTITLFTERIAKGYIDSLVSSGQKTIAIPLLTFLNKDDKER